MKTPLRILHLEDDPKDAELICKILEAARIAFDTVRVQTEAEFLAAIEKDRFDLILADYSLPSFDGVSAMVATRKSHPEVPFIFVSGTMGEDIAIESLKSGATDYVLKNHLSRLGPAIQRALREVRERTEHRQSEAAALQSEQRYQLLFETMLQGVVQQDADGRIILANPAAERILGRTLAEIQGLTSADLEHPILQVDGARFLGREHPAMVALRTGKPLRDVLMQVYNPMARAYRWISVCAVPLFREKDGRPYQVWTLFDDITERKQAALEQERLATVIEQAAEVVVITDARATILYANPAFEAVTGYRRDEVIGQNPRLLKSGKHDAAFYRNLWDTLARGESWHGHFINKRKDGSLYEEEATISPVRDPAGQTVSYAAVKRDVTKEVMLQDQLLQAQKMEAVGRLAGGVAHDFNNLLMVIGGYSQLLLRKLPAEGRVHQMLEEIERTAQRAAALTRQLLTFSRKQVADPRLMNFCRIIQDTEKMTRQLLPENIRVIQRCDPHTALVKADPGQIQQALMNLVINAGDAMAEGGGVLTLETSNVVLETPDEERFPGVPNGRYATLTVTDTGCGIPPEDQPHLFEPFFTTKDKDKDKGTGLGLSIVFGIVHQAGGHIVVKSKVGEGSSFILLLPEATGKMDEESRTPPSPESLKGNETLLLVEDDEGLREMILQLLESQGYHVILASNGEEALDQWRRHPKDIHLMLTDITLPRMNGMDLMQRIRLLQPDLKVILMSGYSAERIIQEIQSDPRLTFLPKPVSPDSLFQRIRETLDRRPRVGPS